MITKTVADIDAYIAAFPPGTAEKLQQLRQAIRKTVPDAEEVISYQMPAFRYHGILAHFAGYRQHIGFYPGASGIENFKKEISVYKWAKGSVQFPLDKPLPLALIKKIIRFRVRENLEKETIRQTMKKREAAGNKKR